MIVPGSANPLMWGNGDPLDEIGKIERAIRLRAAASAYFSRTFAGASDNPIKWTANVWVKRITLSTSTIQALLGSLNGSSNSAVDYWTFYNNDSIGLRVRNSSLVGVGQVASNALFRDPAQWSNHHIIYDTANATAGDRVRLFNDGNRLSSTFSEAFALNQAPTGNFDSLKAIGRLQDGNSGQNHYADFYLAFFSFVDGQALDPSAFGAFHPLTGQWRPKSKAVIRAAVAAGGGNRNGWGTNGFFLPFDDVTSLTTLGYDRSQSDADTTGNNFTANNISLTAGATYDSVTDSPTANYCTLNPLLSYSSPPAFSEGNLTFLGGTSAFPSVLGTIGMTSGIWAWAVKQNTSNVQIGIAKAAVNLNSFIGIDANGWAYGPSGQKLTNNVSSAYGAAFTSADTIGVLFNADVGTLEFFKQTNSTGPFVSQGIAFTGLTNGPYFPAAADGASGSQEGATFDFGQRGFQPSQLSSNAKALCTKNLPRPIGAALRPFEHFDTLLYTGTGAARDVTSVAFSPDYVMGKDRSAARDFFNYSRPRGVTKYLAANLSSAEQTLVNGLTAFLGNGFTVGSDANSNGNAESFVAWLMRAGGAPVANNAGSIAAMVSANPLAGISIVTYAGNGAASATIGHGLGAAPKFILIKNRQGVGTAEWLVGHDALGWTDNLILNSQGARTTASSRWNNTAPSSTVFTVGNIPNAAGETYEALCIADVPGFSKVFSYIGTGQADGPSVNLGFLPAFTLLKNATSIFDWYIHDAKRAPYNGSMPELYPAGNSTEGSGVGRELDYVSYGLKVRNSNAGHNASGSLYVGLAFAKCSLRYANAR